MYPLKLIPVLKNYIWGGNRLKTEFNKKSKCEIIAESWELACHKDGSSIIYNGEYSGMTLSDFIKSHGKELLGTNCERFEYFPILIKLIDANDNLSVQVHPDNAYALKNEGEYGKTEMWYIIDCDESAELLYGFKHQISKEEFSERIKNNTLLDVVKSVKVKKGDVFFIDSRTLHAIGKNILIAEIQQNSNTTYRVYDYGRVGIDGKPRELHIEKAIDVTNLFPAPILSKNKTKISAGFSYTMLACCEYFTVSHYEIRESADFFTDNTSFNSIVAIKGNAILHADNFSIEIVKGDSFFIPANMGKYKIVGHTEVILTKI